MVPCPDLTIDPRRDTTIRWSATKPIDVTVRLMPVIADPMLHPHRFVAFEVVLRALAIALVALVIFGILPAIVEAAA
jgi:hypothetical protein